MGSNKDNDTSLFPAEHPLKIRKYPPLPQPGYGLIFSQAVAQEISEFVDSPIYRKLKKIYGLQAKDRAARTALNNAQSIEWLSYYRGIAASADLFFKDMEAAKKAYLEANSDSTSKRHKK